MTEQSALERDFVRLNLTNFLPRPYSPTTTHKKIAPVVPPKPKKLPGNGTSTFNTVGLKELDVQQPSTSTNGTGDIPKDLGLGSSMLSAPSSNGVGIAVGSILQSSHRIGDQINNNGLVSNGNNQRPFIATYHHQVSNYNQQAKPQTANGVASARGNSPVSGNINTSMAATTTTTMTAQLRPESPRTPAAIKAQPTYANDPNYANTANYSNPSNYSNSSNYSNVSNYSNMANYSDSSNYSNSSNYSDFSNYDQCYNLPNNMKTRGSRIQYKSSFG